MKTISVGQVASKHGLQDAQKTVDFLGRMRRAAQRVAVLSAGALAVPIMLGLALTAAAPLGTLSALSALTNPAQKFSSAPSQIQWISAAQSPFLEAGRMPDGGINLRKMFEAWRIAGMSPEDAKEAVLLVNQMRPVLMGRADYDAAVEHWADQVSASQQLERKFPEVLAHLRAGTASPGADDWVSAWQETAAQLELDLSHDAHLDRSDPRTRSLDKQVALMHAWNEEHPEMPVPAINFLELGQAPGADFSAVYLMDTLRRADVSPQETEVLLDFLVEATSPMQEKLMMFVKEDLTNIADADAFLWQQFSAAEVATLKAAAKDPSFAVETVPVPARNKARWDNLMARAALQGNASVADVSMEDAQKALEDAVRDTGLRSFTPSLWQMRSASSMLLVAERLQTANQEISKVAGWNGEVIGLGGRVELSMGPVLEARDDAQAMVRADQSGRLQMLSNWQSFGHEWFHAYDFYVAREVMKRPNTSTMTDNIYLLRGVHSPEIKKAFGDLNEGLDDGSPHWQAHREHADKTGDMHYFQRSGETGAFAFSAYLNNSGAKILADPRIDSHLLREPERVPSPEEQAHQKKFFDQVFASTRHLGNFKAATAPQMKSISDWRALKSPQSEEMVSLRQRTIR